jgi:retron-type reverse transcriptase
MATSTTTIRTTTTMSGVCVAESDLLYSFRSLHDAYISCRRRKRNTINALRFEASLLDNLIDLGETLGNGDYKPSRSVCFVAKQPKHREIFAADFRDRVVHHLLVSRIEKIFEPKFIYDSYACRKGKGAHAAMMRLKHFMNRITWGGRVAAWFIQLDIRSFFMSIDKEILLQILSRHVGNNRLMELTKKIVMQDCTKDFVYKGDPRLLRGIPTHKSLFHIPDGKGLPIGNLTSQFFGNVYLNEMDQFVKHKLKEKFYLRYVDDFILLDPSRERLLEMKEKIGEFLKERLALELKPGFTLKRVSEGANFLGYIVRPDYVLVRNRVVGNLRARLRRFEAEMAQDVSKRTYNLKISPLPVAMLSGNWSPASLAKRGNTPLNPLLIEGKVPPLKKEDKGGFSHIHLRKEKVMKLRQTLVSYLGHFKHANAYKLTRSLFEKYGCLKDIFTVDDDNCLVTLYEPPFEPATLRGQYKWATERYVGYCIFFQVGKFCEFYGEQAERYGRFFGLKPRTEKRISGVECGFHIRYLKEFKNKALHTGLPYVVVGEMGCYPSGLKKRIITEIYN